MTDLAKRKLYLIIKKSLGFKTLAIYTALYLWQNLIVWPIKQNS